MTTLFLSGSKNRLGLPLARWLPGVTYLVEPQEHAAYEAAQPGIVFRSLAENDRGFGYLLNAMLVTGEMEGADYLCFLDDDLLGLQGRTAIGRPWKNLMGDEARHVLEQLANTARENHLGQLAVSFKGHSWGARKAYIEPTGAWGLHLTSIAAARAVGGYDEVLPIFNDWDLSARLLLAGYRCMRTNLVTFDHKMRSQPGGAEMIYAQQGRVQQAVDMLRTRYPGLCRVKYVEAHGQPEIRFNWRAAAMPAEAMRQARSLR